MKAFTMYNIIVDFIGYILHVDANSWLRDKRSNDKWRRVHWDRWSSHARQTILIFGAVCWCYILQWNSRWFRRAHHIIIGRIIIKRLMCCNEIVRRWCCINKGFIAKNWQWTVMESRFAKALDRPVTKARLKNVVQKLHKDAW
jgi:hypothetical protein